MIEEVRWFTKLFRGFNLRYDQMNEKLNEIAGGDEVVPLKPGETDVLYDYFNLCAEEYLYYQRGFVLPEVWKAWLAGMRDFYKRSNRIAKCWSEELKSSSYYGFPERMLH